MKKLYWDMRDYAQLKFLDSCDHAWYTIATGDGWIEERCIHCGKIRRVSMG